jgi:hypothetical protein
MRDRPFAYICSPFRGDFKNNVKKARGYCLQVFHEGYTPVAPALLFPQFLDDNIPHDREAGMEMGLALLKQCRIMVVCGDEVTEGMAGEISQARCLRIPVVSLDALPLL